MTHRCAKYAGELHSLVAGPGMLWLAWPTHKAIKTTSQSGPQKTRQGYS